MTHGREFLRIRPSVGDSIIHNITNGFDRPKWSIKVGNWRCHLIACVLPFTKEIELMRRLSRRHKINKCALAPSSRRFCSLVLSTLIAVIAGDMVGFLVIQWHCFLVIPSGLVWGCRCHQKGANYSWIKIEFRWKMVKSATKFYW